MSRRQSLRFVSVANAEYRNGQAPRGCRVASAGSAVMLGSLFFD
jgi:hypothetical protein